MLKWSLIWSYSSFRWQKFQMNLKYQLAGSPINQWINQLINSNITLYLNCVSVLDDLAANKNKGQRIFSGRAQCWWRWVRGIYKKITEIHSTMMVGVIMDYELNLVTHFLMWFSFSRRLLSFVFPCYHSREFNTLVHASDPPFHISGLSILSPKEYCCSTEIQCYLVTAPVLAM